jgi:hypothetical protein
MKKLNKLFFKKHLSYSIHEDWIINQEDYKAHSTWRLNKQKKNINKYNRMLRGLIKDSKK